MRPGLGGLDYATFLKELSKLPGVPLMLEHLPNAAEYEKAAKHIRRVGRGLGLRFALRQRDLPSRFYGPRWTARLP